MITYKHLLSTKQKQDILNALQTGSGVHIKPTKTQLGNVLGTILASIGIPLAVELVKNHTVKPKFHKNIPMSNHDVLEWCRYFNIPIKDVLSRDQTVPHNHKQALVIYNLQPSYMSGSNWVSTCVKDGVINYFDGFGMPPFQEMVSYARSKNLTLLYQNNQIQNIITTTCRYLCLYFLNEKSKGTTYYGLLRVFDIHDKMKNGQ